MGLDIHEQPVVNSKNKEPLPVNAIVTIEPGIYVQGLGGVRIEDDVLVRERGVEVLTHSPRAWADICL